MNKLGESMKKFNMDGFDENGIHKYTGTKYDEFGFNKYYNFLLLAQCSYYIVLKIQ